MVKIRRLMCGLAVVTLGFGLWRVGCVSAQTVGAGAQSFVGIRPGNATGPLYISCDTLPPAAVRVTPSPLDHYATLICTRSGQALKPLDGFAWMFDQGPEMLIATNPHNPSASDHYTALTYRPMASDEVASLRKELAKLDPDPAVLTRPILRFDLVTSWGSHKQIYLLPPPDDAPPDTRTLGMECSHECRPVETDPWFFSVVPTK